MPLDAFCLRAVTQEIAGEICGARIEKIQQPGREQVVLLLRGGKRLLLHAGMNQPRIHLTQLQRDNPAAPPMFCMLLRKYLGGGKIAAVTQPGLERLVRLEIETVDELGEQTRRSLILECMNRHANLILLDREERIIDCLRRVDAEMSPQRQVLPGLYYRLPPARAKQDPLNCTEQTLQQLFAAARPQDSLEQWILGSFFGFSPLLAREMVYRACGETDMLCGALDEAGKERFFRQLQELTEQPARPWLLLREGKAADFSCTEIRQYGPAVTAQRQESFSALLDCFYESREQQERIRQRGQDLLKTARSARDRVCRKLLLQEQDYAATQKREEDRLRGDLITANLYRMQPGMTSLRTENFYDPRQAEVEIPLDPLLTPQQNAARYYRQYNKAKTAEQHLLQQMEKARTERDYLESVLQEIGQAESEQDFLDIRRELQEGGYLRSGGKKQPQRPSRPREFRSTAGLRILVGRNNQQNDRLTLKEADPGDLWFHTQKIHGSHVILCTGGAPADEQSMTEAAMLAAYYSQGRDGSRVAVDYTPARLVKKPAGAPPGKVVYSRYQTAYVTPREELARRLAVKGK